MIDNSYVEKINNLDNEKNKINKTISITSIVKVFKVCLITYNLEVSGFIQLFD